MPTRLTTIGLSEAASKAATDSGVAGGNSSMCEKSTFVPPQAPRTIKRVSAKASRRIGQMVGTSRGRSYGCLISMRYPNGRWNIV